MAFAPYYGGLTQWDRSFVSRRLDELVEAATISGEAIVSATGYLGGDVAGVRRVEALLHQERVDPDFTVRVLSCGGWIDSLSSDEYLRLLSAIAGPKFEHAAAVIDIFGMWQHGRRPIEGTLAEFAWRCLESGPTVTTNEGYYCDELAAQLARSNPERGLKLLENLLTQPYESERWDPLARYGEGKFWSAILQGDRQRALRLVLSLAQGNAVRQFHISWNLQELLDQERDAAILIAFALEGERQAELVSSSITAGRSGFWPIALRIISAYPNSDRIQGALAGAAEHLGLVISGPLSMHYEARRKEVERVRADPTTLSAAEPWLQRLENYFRERSERELLAELEEKVNDLRRIVEDAAAPERIWAITTLLRLGRLEDVLTFMSRKDMIKILPKLQIPTENKRRIRRILNAKV